MVERTRLLAMDHVGIALRARHAADLNDAMSHTLAKLGMDAGSASVIGDERGYAPPAAALYNGNLAHSLDFDDTHARGSIHPSAPIVPAAFAAAEMAGASGRDIIAGIVAGYEVQIRLSIALQPSEHYARGFHPTATCGVFGAAAAAARIFGLIGGPDRQRIRPVRQPGGRLDAISARRRMEQALSYGLRRHGRPDGRELRRRRLSRRRPGPGR